MTGAGAVQAMNLRPRPGTFLWLLAHDVRMNWRQFADLFRSWSARRRIGLAAVAIAAVHIGVLALMALLEEAPRAFRPDGDIVWTLAIAGALWMISQGLLGAARALYQRGELELLLSSPLDVWKPVAARAASVAASSVGSLALFIVPVANAGAWRYGPEWLMIYPVVLSMALAGTALGFLIAVLLFYAVGPRYTRLVAQVSAAVIAGAFVLGFQLLAILPPDTAAQLRSALSRQGTLLPDFGILWLAAGALRGGPTFVAAALLISVAAFLLSLRLAAPAFVSAASVAAGTASSAGAGRSRRFAEGPVTALRIKESRLLARDPNLFAQLGLQIIYTLPLAVILLRGPGAIPPAMALVPLIVVLAAQLSASLSWLSVSAEDAPELIGTAPLAAGRPELAKLSAVALPLCLILALPLAAVVAIDVTAAVLAVGFAAGAALSTALLNFWHPMAGNRRGMLRRHNQSKVVAVAEHGLALLWACATVTAMAGSMAALVPIGLVMLILWCFRPARVPAAVPR